MLLRDLEEAFQLSLIQSRNDRRCHHSDRNTRLTQRPYRVIAFMRRRSARLHRPRKFRIQGRDRHPHPAELLLCHRRDQVQIPLDQSGFGEQRNRMIMVAQDLQEPAGKFLLPLHGLIGIGIHPQRNRARHIAWARQFFQKQVWPIRFVEKLALKIQPGGETMISVRGPREAIDTAMLTPAIRIDRAIKMDVR